MRWTNHIFLLFLLEMSEKVEKKTKILFVCLGNICRSPMAELVMKYTVAKNEAEDNFFIDSAGTAAYHIGESPDSRSVACCQKNLGKDCPPNTHKAQQLKADHFTEFDYVLCMDESNLRNMKRVQPNNSTAFVGMLAQFDPEGNPEDPEEIGDPYYGGSEGFQTNFDVITRCCEALFKECNE
eukprot:TRINITY_DN4110_c0_g2_i2.p1 TRINITY_DN4110_c0_g2~~TRINITY_DN4110_c0_g2_i2.p1  ORF type:complete len:182 (+),score=44.46 TRINITY_DN4110_c0_g2_i2:437-982(+)